MGLIAFYHQDYITIKKHIGSRSEAKYMVLYEAIRKYEGRRTNTQLAETLELAKVEARNWVNLSNPPEWVDESPEWDYKDKPKKLVLQNTPNDTEVFVQRRGVKSEN